MSTKPSRTALALVTDNLNRQLDPWLNRGASSKGAARTSKKRKITEENQENDDSELDTEWLHGAADDICEAANEVFKGKGKRLPDYAHEEIRSILENALRQRDQRIRDILERPQDISREDHSRREVLAPVQKSSKKRKVTKDEPAGKRTISTTASKARPIVTPPIDLTGISLSGEASDSIRVYESCDEIRKKITAHLMTTGTTQAQFCRDLSSQVHLKTRKIQSKQLADFRSKNGPNHGNTSIVFYTAYVFFEKLRLAEGRPKSKHRLGMEKARPEGIDLVRPGRRGYV